MTPFVFCCYFLSSIQTGLAIFCQAETPFKNPGSIMHKVCFCSYVAMLLCYFCSHVSFVAM